MRRSDKEMKAPANIDRILSWASVCRIAMADGHGPYLAPVNFAVQDHWRYFHSATSGGKIEILPKKPRVCFEIDVPGRLITGVADCFRGMAY